MLVAFSMHNSFIVIRAAPEGLTFANHT